MKLSRRERNFIADRVALSGSRRRKKKKKKEERNGRVTTKQKAESPLLAKTDVPRGGQLVRSVFAS